MGLLLHPDPCGGNFGGGVEWALGLRDPAPDPSAPQTPLGKSNVCGVGELVFVLSRNNRQNNP